MSPRKKRPGMAEKTGILQAAGAAAALLRSLGLRTVCGEGLLPEHR